MGGCAQLPFQPSSPSQNLHSIRKQGITLSDTTWLAMVYLRKVLIAGFRAACCTNFSDTGQTVRSDSAEWIFSCYAILESYARLLSGMTPTQEVLIGGVAIITATEARGLQLIAKFSFTSPRRRTDR